MPRRTLLLSALACFLIVAGLSTLNPGLLALAIAQVLFLLAGYWGFPNNVELEIKRTLGAERAAPGLPVRVTLSITNHGTSLKEISLEDFLPSGLQVTTGSNRHLLALPAGASRSISYQVTGSRGYYSYTAVEVEVYGLSGFLYGRKSYPMESHLFVLPPVMRLPRVVILPRRTSVYSGSIPARQGGPGVEFYGVRAYQQFDPPGWINWNVTARHPDSLFTNQFEQERVADVGLVLDGRLRTNHRMRDRSIFDYSVQAAAALSNAFLSQGNRVGLLVYGYYLNWTFPGYGRIQQERLMQALSKAAPGESLVFADLKNIPARLFPAHSQIVFVSPLVQDDYDVLLHLRARGYQVMVVSPDPVGFELTSLGKAANAALAARILHLERETLLNRLRHAGLQVLDWDVSIPFERIGPAVFGRPLAWFRSIGR